MHGYHHCKRSQSASPKTSSLARIGRIVHCKERYKNSHGSSIPAKKRKKHKSLGFFAQMRLDFVRIKFWQIRLLVFKTNILVKEQVKIDSKSSHNYLIERIIKVFNIGESRVPTERIEQQDWNTEKHPFENEPH